MFKFIAIAGVASVTLAGAAAAQPLPLPSQALNGQMTSTAGTSIGGVNVPIISPVFHGKTAFYAAQPEVTVGPVEPYPVAYLSTNQVLAARSATDTGVYASATAPSAMDNSANASFTTQTVTNGPVPDTPENRARYGGPNSRAGKMTAPRGND